MSAIKIPDISDTSQRARHVFCCRKSLVGWPNPERPRGVIYPPDGLLFLPNQICPGFGGPQRAVLCAKRFISRRDQDLRLHVFG